LNIVQKGTDYASIEETVKNNAVNCKAFCKYLHLLYRGYEPTNRPKKLVTFKCIKPGKEKSKESTLDYILWMIATTRNRGIYARRRRRWLPYILFKPRWERLKMLPSKLIEMIFDPYTKELKPLDQRYRKESQIIVLNELLKVIL